MTGKLNLDDWRAELFTHMPNGDDMVIETYFRKSTVEKMVNIAYEDGERVARKAGFDAGRTYARTREAEEIAGEAIKAAKAAAYNRGFDSGREIGRKEGATLASEQLQASIDAAYQRGYSIGKEAGEAGHRAAAYDEGYEHGKKAGKEEAFLHPSDTQRANDAIMRGKAADFKRGYGVGYRAGMGELMAILEDRIRRLRAHHAPHRQLNRLLATFRAHVRRSDDEPAAAPEVPGDEVAGRYQTYGTWHDDEIRCLVRAAYWRGRMRGGSFTSLDAVKEAATKATMFANDAPKWLSDRLNVWLSSDD